MIKRLKSRFIKSVKTKRINIFLLFLGLAFIILILTKLSKDYTKTISFNISAINIPEEQVFLNDSTNVLNVSVETHGFNLLKYYIAQPELLLDFNEDIDRNDSVYFWTKTKFYSKISNQFKKDIKVRNITPDTLLFEFDVNDVKQVPVKLTSDISFVPGYDLVEELSLSPDSIKVIGPKAIIDSIHEVYTEPLTLKEINSDIHNIVKLEQPLNKSIKFSRETIKIDGSVQRFTEGSLKLPINVINVPEDINIKFFPKKVSVTYYVSLNAFRSIKANQFKVVCDYSKIEENQTYLVPEIYEIPSNIKQAKINLNRIDFIITE